MFKKSKSVFLFFLLIALSFSVYAKSFGEQDSLIRSYVNDYAHVLSESDVQYLESYLESVDDSFGLQIAVLTVNSLDGNSIEEFAIEQAESAGLGRKGDDSGVLLAVSMAERKIRIETGYGVEGNLTDTECGLIIRNVIAPEFQKGNFGPGIIAGVLAIAKENGVQLPDSSVRSGQNVAYDYDDDGNDIGAMVFLLFFLIYFFLLSGSIGSRFGLRRWIPWAIFFSSRGGHYHSGHHSSFGGSSFGVSSSGGFHGGGGHFGGGGASGGW